MDRNKENSRIATSDSIKLDVVSVVITFPISRIRKYIKGEKLRRGFILDLSEALVRSITKMTIDNKKVKIIAIRMSLFIFTCI